jgi:AsmA protein
VAHNERSTLGPLRPGGPKGFAPQHRPPQGDDHPRAPRTQPSQAEPRPRAPARRLVKKRTFGLGSVAVFSLLGFVGLAAAAAALVVVATPADLIRDQFAANFKKRTGRDLVIAGPSSLALYPSLALTMSDVSISAPPGMEDTPTLKVAEVDASVRLWPLFSRQVEVERLVLRQPSVEMHVDAQGRRSWDFAEAIPILDRPVRIAQAGDPKTLRTLPPEARDFLRNATPGSTGTRNPLARLEALALNEVRFVDGTVRYRDDRTGTVEEFTHLNLDLGLKSISSPLLAKGDLVWRGDRLAVQARAAPLTALFEDRPAEVGLTLSSPRLEVQYDGNVVLREAPEIDGKITAKAPAVKALLAWLGKPVPEGAALGAGAVNGRIKVTSANMTFADATVALDGMALTGTLSVDTKGARPYLKGTVSTGDLDVNRLVALASIPESATAKLAPAARPAQAAPAANPASIEELLKSQGAPQPQVKGFTSRGWSEAPIELGGLGAVDADIKFSFARVLYRDIKTGAGTLVLALKNKIARVTAEELQLYDGKCRGLITVDGTARGARASANSSRASPARPRSPWPTAPSTASTSRR